MTLPDALLIFPPHGASVLITIPGLQSRRGRVVGWWRTDCWHFGVVLCRVDRCGTLGCWSLGNIQQVLKWEDTPCPGPHRAFPPGVMNFANLLDQPVLVGERRLRGFWRHHEHWGVVGQDEDGTLELITIGEAP